MLYKEFLKDDLNDAEALNGYQDERGGL